MEQHQLTGVVIMVVGLLDAAAAMWVPSRMPDERQRTLVRIALLSSGVVVVTIGGLFFAGLFGKPA